MIVRFAKVTILLFVMLIAAAFLPVVVFAQDDASAAIASAKQQLVVCYGAARQAESAGGNVTHLSFILNGASDLLSRAELAYSQGDLGGAESLASQCSQSLSNFVASAESLRENAVVNARWGFAGAIASIVGATLVIVSGFLVWRQIRRRFVPVEVEGEVETDESS
jgi:hypothetical protein